MPRVWRRKKLRSRSTSRRGISNEEYNIADYRNKEQRQQLTTLTSVIPPLETFEIPSLFVCALLYPFGGMFSFPPISSSDTPALLYLLWKAYRDSILGSFFLLAPPPTADVNVSRHIAKKKGRRHKSERKQMRLIPVERADSAKRRSSRENIGIRSESREGVISEEEEKEVEANHKRGTKRIWRARKHPPTRWTTEMKRKLCGNNLSKLVDWARRVHLLAIDIDAAADYRHQLAARSTSWAVCYSLMKFSFSILSPSSSSPLPCTSFPLRTPAACASSSAIFSLFFLLPFVRLLCCRRTPLSLSLPVEEKKETRNTARRGVVLAIRPIYTAVHSAIPQSSASLPPWCWNGSNGITSHQMLSWDAYYDIATETSTRPFPHHSAYSRLCCVNNLSLSLSDGSSTTFISRVISGFIQLRWKPAECM